MSLRSASLLLLMVPMVFSLTVINPDLGDMPDGSVIELGTIGPGQTFEILFDNEVASGGIHGIGGLYDLAYAGGLPPGWKSAPSKLYQKPLQVKVTAAQDAIPGDYSFNLFVEDENDGEHLGTLVYEAKVRITYDVMSLEVSPDHLIAGPGQPANFLITLKNKASTGDVFQVGSVGAKRWEFERSIFLAPGETKTLTYPIVGHEEETIKPTISVVSRASPLIHDKKEVTLVIESDLIGDCKAANNGVLIFPVFQVPIYAIAGLLSNLF